MLTTSKTCVLYVLAHCRVQIYTSCQASGNWLGVLTPELYLKIFFKLAPEAKSLPNFNPQIGRSPPAPAIRESTPVFPGVVCLSVQGKIILIQRGTRMMLLVLALQRFSVVHHSFMLKLKKQSKSLLALGWLIK